MARGRDRAPEPIPPPEPEPEPEPQPEPEAPRGPTVTELQSALNVLEVFTNGLRAADRLKEAATNILAAEGTRAELERILASLDANRLPLDREIQDTKDAWNLEAATLRQSIDDLKAAAAAASDDLRVATRDRDLKLQTMRDDAEAESRRLVEQHAAHKGELEGEILGL